MKIREKTKRKVADILGIEKELLFNNFYFALSKKKEKKLFNNQKEIHKNFTLSNQSYLYLVWGHPTLIFKFLNSEKRFDVNLFKVLQENLKGLKLTNKYLFKVKTIKKIRKKDKLIVGEDPELEKELLKKILRNTESIKVKMAIALMIQLKTSIKII